MTSWIRKLLALRAASAAQPHRPPIDPVEAARDNDLNKAGKLGLAERAVMLDHLREVAKDEVDAVRRLRARHLGKEFAGCGGADDVGDIIVGDDIHFHEPRGGPPPSRAWPLIAGLTLGGALVAAGLALPQWLAQQKAGQQPAQQQPAITAQPGAGQPSTTTIEKRSGFILDLPGGTK